MIPEDVMQFWADSRRSDFAKECRYQCLLVAQADSADAAIQALMDVTAEDVEAWTE